MLSTEQSTSRVPIDRDWHSSHGFGSSNNASVLAASYALSKQVPAMEDGFTIQTSYGDLVIKSGPGPGAERIRAAVKKELEAQLAKAERAAA